MKKRKGNSRSKTRCTGVVGGNTILFYYANRNVRDHDVNYPIFFSTVSAVCHDGLLINFETVIRFCCRPGKNMDAHSIIALAMRQFSLLRGLDALYPSLAKSRIANSGIYWSKILIILDEVFHYRWICF